jgi:glutamate-ammonia-ligase adenylyltransferase
LAAVARALGYPADGDPGEFVDEYRRITRRARTVVERVFYDE